jgi:hemoglobin/transferrin/lactoferrin receptor protein
MQRSQQGGGSPVIRGFEASRVLLMVDGVRMNNAIYRAGHLQNIITVDPNILQNLEILYGPSSTLYGSDALGGVLNIFTRDPKLAIAGQKPAFTANAHTRYSSAIGEKMGHIDLNYGSDRWASLTSLTFTSFGNVRTGKNANQKYPQFGLKPFYVKRVANRDSLFVNDNPYKQKPSGYHQWDVMQKVLFKPNVNTSHVLNVQLSTSSDISRYDRLTEMTGGLPRFAEWYYGPQKRYLTSYKFEKKNMDGFFNDLRAVASYQHIEESRYDRRFRQAVRNERIEKINVAGLTIDARKLMTKNELVVGADFQANDLESTAHGYNVDDGSLTRITTRYPDGDNKMYYAAVFAQHLLKITDRLTLHDGLRLNYVHLHSTFIDKSLINFPFDEAAQEQAALSGNAGLVYAANDNFKISTVFSTGFRAANFDDLAKVFDTRAGSVTVPNPDLKAEYTYNAELNIAKYFPVGNNPFGASVGGSVFYTWFHNAIVVGKFRFNEADSIIYNGVQSAVLANQNKAKAQLWGYNVFGNLYFSPYLQLNGTVTYTYGRYINNNTEIPLDHIPPVFGRVGLRYEKAKLSAEVNTIFNGWKRIEDYNPNGEDNQQYATPEGMPSWYTINARANYAIAKHVTAQVGVENILDKRYRSFSSGISAPGRNFILALKTDF